ncbi:MAG: hypothetical protein JWP91_1423 [Fibrobacteres bacterium]|nr:hypothetical protein [Fibrobacterota bacterium]
MRAILAAAVLGAVLLNPHPAFPNPSDPSVAAIDMLPTKLSVVMSDSVHNPESDSVTVTLSIMAKGAATPARARWTAAQIGIEGTERMNGIVDSAQTMAAGVEYTYKIGAWVDKKPFSVIAITDPNGVLGETSAAIANNVLVRTCQFRRAVEKDTVYTGKDCVVPARRAD